MNLREKIIEVFYKSATSTRKIRNLLTPIGAIFYLTLLVLFIIASIRLDNFLSFPKTFSSPLNIILSLPLFGTGLWLYFWSVLHFIKAKGTPVPFSPPPKLVTIGPYAYVRNPMLTGVFILLFALGILFQSISLLFIFTPLFILFNVLELKTIEEPELERRLGEEYLEYKKKVPMFIPWLKMRQSGKHLK